MKLLRLYALAVAVLAAPYVLVLLAGWWWLYEQGYFLWWALSAAVLLIAGRALLKWLRERNRDAAPSDVQASSDWAPSSEPAWKKVEEFSARVRSENWPLDQPGSWEKLFRQLFETVAREYRPDSANPLLEAPVTHIAGIIERVSRDVRRAADEKLPGGHILTVNDWIKAHYYVDLTYRLYARFYPLYRALRLGLNPAAGVVGELRDHVSTNIVEQAPQDARGWLLDFVIRRAGGYAIELYSGHHLLDPGYVTERSARDAAQAAGIEAKLEIEPLRMLLVGQVSAGKSSVINALFGEVMAAVDVLPTTRGVTPLVFEREGIRRALIFDSPGYGSAESRSGPFAELADDLLHCDLVLLVCSAMTAARQPDRQLLTQLRARWQCEPQRRPPPILVVLTHIDQLRPASEWQPPYDLLHPESDKGRRIAAATMTVSEELNVPIESVVPVCLAPGRLYNIEEGLLAAMVECLPESARAKALRCLSAFRRDEESWRRVWRQTLSAGKLIGGLAAGKLWGR